jgi:hypothetical protein
MVVLMRKLKGDGPVVTAPSALYNYIEIMRHGDTGKKILARMESRMHRIQESAL